MLQVMHALDKQERVSKWQISHSNLCAAKDYIILNLIEYLKLCEQITSHYLTLVCDRKVLYPIAKPFVPKDNNFVEETDSAEKSKERNNVFLQPQKRKRCISLQITLLPRKLTHLQSRMGCKQKREKQHAGKETERTQERQTTM